MRYFKKIDIDHLDTIQTKALEFVEKDNYVYYQFGPAFNRLNVEAFLDYVPEVDQAFAKYGIKCVLAAAYVMWDNNTPIHKDNEDQWGQRRAARINIPLLNCKNTQTSFYSNVEEAGGFYLYKEPKSGQYSHRIKHPELLKFEGSVEIDKATVLRVNEPHRPTVDPDNPGNVPRITLTLGFDPDPAFLLNDPD